MATLTIYGVQTNYDPKTKRTDSELRTLEIELAQMESWRAPLGFNVTTIAVGNRERQRASAAATTIKVH